MKHTSSFEIQKIVETNFCKLRVESKKWIKETKKKNNFQDRSRKNTAVSRRQLRAESKLRGQGRYSVKAEFRRGGDTCIDVYSTKAPAEKATGWHWQVRDKFGSRSAGFTAVISAERTAVYIPIPKSEIQPGTPARSGSAEQDQLSCFSLLQYQTSGLYWILVFGRCVRAYFSRTGAVRIFALKHASIQRHGSQRE